VSYKPSGLAAKGGEGEKGAAEEGEAAEGEEGAEGAPEKIKLKIPRAVTLEDDGIVYDGYKFDMHGNITKDGEPAMAHNAELRSLQQYLKSNLGRLQQINYSIDRSTPQRSHMKLALIALQLTKMTAMKGIDEIDFLHHNLHVLIEEFTYGHEGKRGLENIGAIWSAASGLYTKVEYELGAINSSDVLHAGLDRIVGDIPRLRRIMRSKEAQKLISSVIPQKTLEGEQNDWNLMPSPSWSDGGGIVSLGGFVIYPPSEELSADEERKFGKVREFIQQNEDNLAELLDIISPSNPEKAETAVLGVALMLKKEFVLTANDTNPFTYRHHRGDASVMTYEVQQTRWDRLIRRVSGSIGPGSRVSETISELFPVLDVERAPGELLFLSGTQLAFGSGIFNAVAAEIPKIQLFNPVDSGNLITVTTVVFSTDVVTDVRATLSATPETTNLGGAIWRDSRVGVARLAVGQVRGSSAAGGIAQSLLFRMLGDESQHLHDENGIVVLSPGTGFTFAPNATNVRFIVSFLWRERPAQESELQF